jgi:uncharacterized protein (TIGR03437 family)
MIRAALCLAAAAIFGSAAYGQCNYKVAYDTNGNVETVALEAQYQAGQITIYVITNSGCSWQATTPTSWLHVVGGQQGTGPGNVTLQADQNSNTASRVGSVNIQGNVVTVTQDALLGPSGVVYELSISKSSGAQGSFCNVTVSNGEANLPAPQLVYSSSDAEVFLTFVMQNLNVGDQVTSQYYAPNGSLYSGAGAIYPSSNNLTSGGYTPECDTPASGLKIFGTPVANMGGNWTVELLLNGTLILEVPFTINGPSCSYALSGNTNSYGGSGGSGSISVTANPGCSWNATTSSTWIHIASSGLSGSGSGSVPYTVDANTGGARSGTIVIAGQSFTITEAAAGPNGPSISQGGVAEPWTNSQGLAPGAWVSLYGSNLASSTLTWSPAAGQPLPTSLGGVNVTIDGQPAPISFISPGQLNVLVPAAVRTGPIQISVSNNGNVGSPYSITSNTYLPAIFASALPGSSPTKYYVAAVDPVTFQIVGTFAANANAVKTASRGEIIDLYVLGLGPASQFPTNIAFTGAYPVSASVTVFLGGTTIIPQFADLVGPGLYQVRITIPQSTTIGDQLISLIVNGTAQTPQNVYLTVGQ